MLSLTSILLIASFLVLVGTIYISYIYQIYYQYDFVHAERCEKIPYDVILTVRITPNFFCRLLRQKTQLIQFKGKGLKWKNLNTMRDCRPHLNQILKFFYETAAKKGII